MQEVARESSQDSKGMCIEDVDGTLGGDMTVYAGWDKLEPGAPNFSDLLIV